MSEGPDLSQDEAPVGEEAFEAARLAEEGDGGQDGIKPEGEQDDDGDKPAVDYQKVAADAKGQAAKERARRRETERQLREVNERLARLETTAKPAKQGGETLESLIAAMPDPEEDPLGATAAITKIVRMFGEQQATETEAETRANTERQRITTLANAMMEAEQDFAADHPDYEKAMEHFKAARQSDFEDMGYAGEGLKQALGEDLLGLVSRAIQGGRDPAEVVYNLAKKRGFKAGETQQNDKLKEIAAAANAGRTPVGGKHGETRLTADAVNKLKGAAYDSAWAKLREQERRAG